MEGWCSECNFSSWCFLVDHCYTITAVIGSTVSKVAFLKLFSQSWVFHSQTDHNCHVHGKLNSLNWYCWLCRRMDILLLLTESTGWSWLLWIYQTNSTDSTMHQSSKCLTDNAWSGGKTRLFLVMLSRQHSWADLQWLSTIGSIPLLPNSFPSNV